MAKVYQVNTHHAIDATAITVGKYPDSIYLVQETYHTTSGKPGVRKRAHYYGKPESRAGIYTSSLQSCHFVPMHEFIDQDITTGTLEGGSLNESLIVSSVYLDIMKPEILPKFKELVEYCIRKNLRLICGIDSNAHSTLWGSQYTNPRGEDLEEFIFEFGLYVENIGRTPTWQARGSATIIDITLSLNMGDSVRNWRVTDDITFSDHNLIAFAVEQPVAGKVFTRNYSKADWKTFSSFLEAKLGNPPDVWSKDTIEKSVLNLCNIIEQALDLSCPKHLCKKRETILWWNSQCQNAKSRYAAIERKMRRIRCPNDEIRTTARVARKALKRAVRRAKRESFRNLVQETSTVPAMSKLNKILDRKESSVLGLVRKPDGTMSATTVESLEVMLREHFPGSQPFQVPEDVPQEHPLCENNLVALDPLDWIDNSKIKRAIAQFGPEKTAGPDEFKPLVLQHLPEDAISYLRCIYTACIQISFTPSKWCHSRVIFMPKPNKTSYLEPRSFRPISLACFLFKGLEKLTVWRVEDTALRSLPLHPRQYAFRKNKSTDNALTESVNVIEKALLRGQMAIAIYIDIKGAFDNVTTGAIVKALEDRGIEKRIVSWYRNYLENRTSETKLGASNLRAKLTRGAPQGGCGSPTLGWNIPYDSLLWSYDYSGANQFGFADDTKLVVLGFDFEVMLSIAQTAIDIAVTWAQKTGVEFCTNKTQVLFFTKSRFVPYKNLHLYGDSLPWSKDAKYLGITIDHKLTFRKHIQNRVAAAKRKLMILRQALGNVWGPSPAITKWAYTGVVRPSLTYGSVVWAHKAKTPPMVRKLNSLQRIALNMISGVRHSTPTAALEIIYNISPLDLFIKENSLKTAARLGISPKWVPQGTKGHQHILFVALPKSAGRGLDDTATTMVWEKNYTVHIGNGTDIRRRDIACYTDGSKMDGLSGAGGIIVEGNKIVYTTSFSLGSCSVFQSEVKAITAVAKKLLRNETKFHFVDFLVDNQAALKSLDNPVTLSDTVREAKLALNELGKNNCLNLRWIRAHVKWKFNELADKAAKAGCKPNCIRKGQEPLPTKRTVYSDIQASILSEWMVRWSSGPGCRQSKYFLRSPSKSLSDLLLKHPRDTVSRVIRFLTGHAFLRRHNNIVLHGISPPIGDISCRLCEDPDQEETPHHIITECERLCNWRAETLGHYVLDEYIGWHPRPLIKFLKHKLIILLEVDD